MVLSWLRLDEESFSLCLFSLVDGFIHSFADTMEWESCVCARYAVHVSIARPLGYGVTSETRDLCKRPRWDHYERLRGNGGNIVHGILLQGMPFSDAAQGIMSMALLDARNKEHECAFLDATGISEWKGWVGGLDSLGLTFTFFHDMQCF